MDKGRRRSKDATLQRGLQDGPELLTERRRQWLGAALQPVSFAGLLDLERLALQLSGPFSDPR